MVELLQWLTSNAVFAIWFWWPSISVYWNIQFALFLSQLIMWFQRIVDPRDHWLFLDPISRHILKSWSNIETIISTSCQNRQSHTIVFQSFLMDLFGIWRGRALHRMKSRAFFKPRHHAMRQITRKAFWMSFRPASWTRDNFTHCPHRGLMSGNPVARSGGRNAPSLYETDWQFALGLTSRHQHAKKSQYWLSHRMTSQFLRMMFIS
jgi:hypothetical protein